MTGIIYLHLFFSPSVFCVDTLFQNSLSRYIYTLYVYAVAFSNILGIFKGKITRW